MPCFGSSDDSRFTLIPAICIHCSFPPDPEVYLPRLTEHKIQTEPHDIIDDPSSIFFDPNEKAGFVYTHVPSIIFEYDKQLILTLPENKHELVTIATEKEHTERERQISICSEYADSLDRTPSLAGSPLHESNTYNNGFDEHFKPLSRQDSLEFDPIVNGQMCPLTLNNKDYCRPLTNHQAGLSEDDVRKLYETSHQPFFIDDFNDLNIYEEDILNDIAKSNGAKGYVSDAESVKTYQDSGIYDDDIIIESPSRPNHRVCMKEKLFNDEDLDLQIEKYSPFKTPLSSRHNSLEYLALESPIKNMNKYPRKTDDEGGGEDAEENAASEIDSLDLELIESFIDLQANEKRWKRSDKYSHIQAKVQCFRSKAERSLSPGASLRRKTPDALKPRKSDLKRTQSRIGVKPKVDSLSNVKYTPGGGGTKVFKEKLKFRENAQPRTDTHGIEMYAHLPTEFQEIARRLARQDNQLKEQKSRGRSLSRSRSSASRQSSRSPKRGRSRTKKSKTLTAGDSITNIHNEVNQKKLTLESLPIVKPPSLSRSSSIRSVPSAPKISQHHPSSSKLTRTPSMTSQSPGASTQQGDSKSKTKKKDITRAKDIMMKTKETTLKLRENTPKLKENTPKLKENTLKLKENTPKMKENTPKMKEISPKMKDISPKTKEILPKMKELTPSNNVSSLCQYISENESFGSKQRSIPVGEDFKSNPVSSLRQYISDNEILESTNRPVAVGGEDIKSNPVSSLCQFTPDSELFDSTQFSSNARFHVVPAH